VTLTDRPLYLYFLDRELGRLLPKPIEADTVERLLKIILLATTSTLYCGISLLWESQALSSEVLQFISTLVSNNCLDIISHHGTAGEFLESRRSLYAHDRDRYPMYFTRLSDQIRSGIHPTRQKHDSTTDALNQQLLTWVGSKNDKCPRTEAVVAAKNIVGKTLFGRKTEAITLSLFDMPALDTGRRELLSNTIQRQISKLYVGHYMGFGGADIPTGIPRLDFLEGGLSLFFPIYDVVLMEAIFNSIGLWSLLVSSWLKNEDFWMKISEWRGQYIHASFCAELRLIIKALGVAAGNELTHYAVREKILAILRSVQIGRRPVQELDWTNMLYRLQEVEQCLRRNKDIAKVISSVKDSDGQNDVDVILVTVSDIERDTVLRVFNDELGREPLRSYGARKTYYDFGIIGGARVLMVQSEMGSVSPGASYSTVVDACDEKRPTAVVLVGIAFGVDNRKQKVGDVLVSKQVCSYEQQRVGTAEDNKPQIVLRGSTADASPRLVDRFRSAAIGWGCAEVRVGTILSGEKLIDNLDFRDDLLELKVGAIGGEMEGAGAYAAAVERNTDWIVVKSICDWADGTKKHRKEERQALAAENSARLVFRALALGGFAPMHR
jgi:nucleoside phosphorylase